MKKPTLKSIHLASLVELPVWRHLFIGGLLMLAVLLLLALALAFGQWFGQTPKTAATSAGNTLSSDAARVTAVPSAAFARNHELTVGENDAMKIINPLYASSDGEMDAVSLIFESLVLPDEQGKPVGQLADSWSFDAKSRQLTFQLRTDHTFRDGRVVAPADVVFTYQCLLADSYDGPLRGRLDDIVSVAAGKDESSVVFTLADSVETPDFDWFSIGILKSDYYQVDLNHVAELQTANPDPEGSGSYYLADNHTGRLVLQLRSGYGGLIRTINLLKVASDEKYPMLLAGKLDIVRNNWDARMQERSAKLPGYSCHPFTQSVETYFLVNPAPQADNLIQRPSQRLAVLLTVAGKPLSDLQQSALQELAGRPLSLYYFKGLEASIQNSNQAKAEVFAAKLRQAGLTVELSGENWPDLAARAVGNNYDILLLPATSNNRLPEQAVLLADPVQPAASALVGEYRPEVFLVCKRITQLTINPAGHPFSALAGTWTDRIENVRILKADGSYLEEEAP